MLKIQSISHDPLTQVAAIRFAEIFEEHPQISVLMTLSTLDSQTQAEVQIAIKAAAKKVLGEAADLCS
jgi:hypothetical protein